MNWWKFRILQNSIIFLTKINDFLTDNLKFYDHGLDLIVSQLDDY